MFQTGTSEVRPWKSGCVDMSGYLWYLSLDIDLLRDGVTPRNSIECVWFSYVAGCAPWPLVGYFGNFFFVLVKILWWLRPAIWINPFGFNLFADWVTYKQNAWVPVFFLGGMIKGCFSRALSLNVKWNPHMGLFVCFIGALPYQFSVELMEPLWKS